MQNPSFYTLDEQFASTLLQPRPLDGHKGTFGHLLLVAGHHGMMGAALLAAEAALRSGLGKLTAHVPETANIIFQTQLPEAILHFDEQSHQHWASIMKLEGYNAVAIGPGLGTDGETQWAFRATLKQLFDRENAGNRLPLVLDADALNMLAQDYQLLSYLPTDTVLTPHVGEMKRLCKALELPYENPDRLLDSAQQVATSLKVYVVLKSHQTHICTSDGEVHQLDTKGNSGLAKAGSGDLLTGLISGLLAQGYTPKHAALLGVFLHHLAGDFATSCIHPNATIASDILHGLPEAFRSLDSTKDYKNEI